MENRNQNRGQIMAIDKSLSRFKSHPIPQNKIDSANDLLKATNFLEVFPDFNLSNY